MHARTPMHRYTHARRRASTNSGHCLASAHLRTYTNDAGMESSSYALASVLTHVRMQTVMASSLRAWDTRMHKSPSNSSPVSKVLQACLHRWIYNASMYLPLDKHTYQNIRNHMYIRQRVMSVPVPHAIHISPNHTYIPPKGWYSASMIAHAQV